MRRVLLAVAMGASVWCGVLAAAPSAPELVSVYPFGGQQGAEFIAIIRGRSLDSVTAVWFDCEHLSATVSGMETEKTPGTPKKAPAGKKSSGGPQQLLTLAVKVSSEALAGVHYLRLMGPGGLSNELPVRVHAEASILEADARHEQAQDSQQIASYPVVVNGKLAMKGEVDYYSFEVQQGVELRFDALTAGGGFDPSLTLFEPAGSWFRSDRLTELAFNDEPISYPGLPLHATLSYRFAKRGRYLIRVGGFLGEGGPNHYYQLSIRRASPEDASPDDAAKGPMRAAHLTPPSADVAWMERTWSRPVNPDRLRVLWSRTVPSGAAISDMPVLRIDDDPHGASSGPVPVDLPVLIEGIIERPADIDRVKFSVKGGDRIAIEVQTLQKSLPEFNPYVRIVSTDGDEAFTNVHSRLNTCGDTIIKQVEPKAIYSFPRAGEFILEIRDITHNYGGRAFAYRVALRPQVPHVGEVRIGVDQVNLVAGEVGKLSVDADQEEGFDGEIALAVEGLPPGVRAVVGAELEAQTPPPYNPGRIERFRPESQRATFLFLTDPSAPATVRPVEARVMAQPVMKGKMGRPILVKKILFTVVQPSPVVTEDRASRPAEAR